jgi:hypothetical protein
VGKDVEYERKVYFIPKKIFLPIIGISFDACGTNSANKSKSKKNAANMLIPSKILLGVSGGNQKTTYIINIIFFK